MNHDTNAISDNKKRIPYLDTAKILCALLVVIGHFIPEGEDPVRVCIYTFHMPFFFFVSGLFHKNTGMIQWGKYLRTLIVPALFFTILTIAVDALEHVCGYGWISIGHEYFSSQHWIGCFCNMLINELTQPWKFNYDGVCWFLGTLFWCKVFTDSLDTKKYWLPALIIAASAPMIYYLHEPIAFCIIPAIKAWIFYLLAYKGKNIILQLYEQKWTPILIIASILLMVPLILLNGRVSLLGFTMFGQLPLPINVIVFYINALLGSIALIGIARYLPISERFTRSLANALITILGMQSIFFDGYQQALKLGVPPYWLILILSILIIAICYILHLLFETICPTLIGKKRKS